MSIAGFMWECKCGYMESGEESPEECPECFRSESFIQLPEELIAERERDLNEDLDLMAVKVKKFSKPNPKKGGKKNESKKKKKGK